MNIDKEKSKKLMALMQVWQKVEDSSVRNATEIIKRTDNPLIQIIMEIIRQDSVMHRRVQQIIIDNSEKMQITFTEEEFANFWELIDQHNYLEKQAVDFAKEALADNQNPVITFLIEYLLMDESKHDKLLDNIKIIKNI